MIKSFINLPLTTAREQVISARTATATKAVLALLSYVVGGGKRAVVPLEDLAEICGVKPKTIDGALDDIAHATFRQLDHSGDIFVLVDLYEVDGVMSVVADFDPTFAYRSTSSKVLVSVPTVEFGSYKTLSALFLRMRIGGMGNTQKSGVYRLRADMVDMLVGHAVPPSVAADDFLPRAVSEINRLSAAVYVETWGTTRLNDGPRSRIGRFDIQYRWLKFYQGQFTRREHREVEKFNSPHKTFVRQASALKGYRRVMPPKTRIEPLS